MFSFLPLRKIKTEHSRLLREKTWSRHTVVCVVSAHRGREIRNVKSQLSTA
jgi:hypothetical protein